MTVYNPVPGGGISGGTDFIVYPSLASLALNLATVTGGGISVGNVTLNVPVLAEGVVVFLSSSGTSAATVQATVLVPAGAASAKFDVKTNKVSSAKNLTISASYRGRKSRRPSR